MHLTPEKKDFIIGSLFAGGIGAVLAVADIYWNSGWHFWLILLYCIVWVNWSRSRGQREGKAQAETYYKEQLARLGHKDKIL